MIECEFIKQNMLVETYSGSVNVDDIILLKEQEFAHEKYKDGIKIIADLRNAEFIFNPEESFKLKKFFAANYNRMMKTKIAFLTGETKKNSYSLFMKTLDELNADIKIQLFTGVKEANIWLAENNDEGNS